jgi:hypothetical protein
MLTELGLFVRSTCGGAVRLNGRALGENWEAIQGSARIDIGMAGLQVDFSSETLLQTLEMPAPHARSADPMDDESPDHSGVRPSYPLLQHEPVSELPAQRNSLLGWRFSRYSLPDAPSVLGRYRPPASKFWLVLISVLALGGYAGWVALLD